MPGGNQRNLQATKGLGHVDHSDTFTHGESPRIRIKFWVVDSLCAM